MKKILLILASTRQHSYNRQVKTYIEKALKDKAETANLEYFDLPLMNQDTENPVPEAVERVRKAVLEADGLWFFSPEYNRSYPGVLKNMLDWLSRPMNPNSLGSGTAIQGKRCAITGIGGRLAAKGMRDKLSELLKFIGAEPMKESCGLTVQPEEWSTQTLSHNPERQQKLDEYLASFLQFLEE